jgi:DNA-binding Lrp family transcriptional regulator
MDKLDMQILTHIVDNCRTPDRQIGKDIGISGVAVKSRIQKMMNKKIIKGFNLKIEPPVLGYSVLYFVVIGKEFNDILSKIRLVGEPFFVVPCVGGVTVCSIVVKDEPAKKMELAKNLLKDVRVLNVFEARNPEIRSDLTKTDLEMINTLLKDPRLKIEEIAKLSGFSTKTVARSIEKLQNDEAIQFTLIYDPRKMEEYIPFAILVSVPGDIRATLEKLRKEFSSSFLQRPFVHMNYIVLFMYSNNLFMIDDMVQKVHSLHGVQAADLFIPKMITFSQKWVRDAIEQAKKSKKLHLTPKIHS